MPAMGLVLALAALLAPVRSNQGTKGTNEGFGFVGAFRSLSRYGSVRGSTRATQGSGPGKMIASGFATPPRQPYRSVSVRSV